MFIKSISCILLSFILTGYKDNESLKYSFSKMQHYLNLSLNNYRYRRLILNYQLTIQKYKYKIGNKKDRYIEIECGQNYVQTFKWFYNLISYVLN